MEHCRQWYATHEVRRFDYGTERNLEEYGTEIPPEIDFDPAFGIPLAVTSGLRDRISSWSDVNNFYLNRNLGPIVFNQTYNYNELSYFIAQDMSYLDDINGVIQDYMPHLLISE